MIAIASGMDKEEAETALGATAVPQEDGTMLAKEDPPATTATEGETTNSSSGPAPVPAGDSAADVAGEGDSSTATCGSGAANCTVG